MLNTADVCVNPDVANEMNDKSTMNKIMEYMALGKPIVQFDLTEGRSRRRRPRSTPGATTTPTWPTRSSRCSTTRCAAPRMGAFGRDGCANELEWRYEAPKLLAAYEAAFAVTR